MISPTQRPLPDNTTLTTDIHRTPLDEWSARHRDPYLATHNTHDRQTSTPLSGIRTRDLSRRMAVNPSLRPHGYWDLHLRHFVFTHNTIRSSGLPQKITVPHPVKHSANFMESWRPLSQSQQRATCPCSEPHQSSPWPKTHFLKTHFNIILPPIPVAYIWFLSLLFLHQHPVFTFRVPHACYMPIDLSTTINIDRRCECIE